MQRVAVYFNQFSSNADLLHWKKVIESTLFRYQLNFKIPISLDKLEEELKRDMAWGVDYIIGIGGDGTANRIIQTVAGGKAALFFIPAGTANDLCHQLKIKGDKQSILNIFKEHYHQHIDLIQINQSYMATNGGLGIANDVALKINRYRKVIPGFKWLMSKLGGKIYSLILVLHLCTRPLKRLHLRLESYLWNGPKDLKASMVFINNQPVLGNSFRLAPETVNNDGSFNVLVLTHSSLVGLMRAIIRVKWGKFPTDDPNFISFETKQLKITQLGAKPLVFFGDGEQLTEDKVFEIGIIDQFLKVSGSRGEEGPIGLDTIRPLL